MNTKYIILFCLTNYYIPTVISYDNFVLEVKNRFNEIKEENEDYITFNSLNKTFDKYEVDELQYVMDTYGDDFNGENGYYQRRVYIDKFNKSVRKGLINRFQTSDLIEVFFIIINCNGIGFITQRDLERHFRERITTFNIKFIMTTYGTESPDGHRLSFHGFRRAVNTLLIPIM
ncbi:uncharacterized protein LOC126834656 [Adelges cooleyi]|uniref:uncharacterized protein LOC126834656 n=1 Tax=Adelges cooleyi TaxID=133065 RepID=UPI00217FE172|nr:uncharacterized protein LOC126834656 [Adelges cooleyi]